MTLLETFILALGLLLAALHVATTSIAAYRCRKLHAGLPPPDGAPAVSILRPVCGVDSFDERRV
jgi:hypothetical protein